MPGHDIAVVGFSAGGHYLLLHAVSALRGDLPAPRFAVQHFPSQSVAAPRAIVERTLPRAALPRTDIAGARQALVGTQAAA